MTERQPPEQRRRKRRRWRLRRDDIKAEWSVSGGLTVAGSGVIGALLVVLFWWVFQQQPQVEVPDLAGMSRVVAETQLKNKGLNLHATFDEASTQPTGTVLRTDPAAGAKLGQGGGVSLVLAAPGPSPTPPPPVVPPSVVVLPPVVVPPPAVAPPPVVVLPPAAAPPPAVIQPPAPVPHPTPVLRQVPDVVGFDLVRAERTLAANKLAAGSVTKEVSDQRAQTVLRTNPRAGTTVWPGSSVDLVVATPRRVLVPNVVGYDRATAERTLAANKLAVGSVTEEASSQCAPTVLRTNPVAGTEVQPGSKVNLVLAKLVLAKPPAVSGHSTDGGSPRSSMPCGHSGGR
jgi:eukaryotic-like serine/threonine-protein kinase